MAPSLMRGILLTGHGGLDKLQIHHDLPIPTPGPGDVLVKVAAAGVNNTDINTRIGWYAKSKTPGSPAGWSGNTISFPRIQGADVCGHIAQTGPGVSQERIGQRVIIEPCLVEAGGKPLSAPWYLGSECDGGFADYTVVASRHAVEVRSSFTDSELASFPCSYSTAENLLTRSGVTNRDRVLITGASGGVGSAAVQLAKARGAHVLAVTSPDKSERLSALGADEILERNGKQIRFPVPGTIDVVIDLVGGDTWPKLIDTLKPGGRYAVAGAIAGPMVELDLRTLYLKDLRFFGCTVLDKNVFRNLVSRIEQGHISPVVSETFPLESIREAQIRFMEKEHVGKIVLTF